jgi:C1A family cysteine protease
MARKKRKPARAGSRKHSGPAVPRSRRFALGWIPDLPDHRDYMYGTLHAPPPSLPQTVDLRHSCSAIEDQGRLGSCTANALVGNLEFLEKKDGVTFADLSRLFIYYNERVIIHTVKEDSGAMLRDGIKTLAKQGVCTEKKWPYAISKFTAKPTAACYREALDHQITSYQRILTLDEMLGCLADGYPFVFGFTVYESFESPQTASTGVAEMPTPTERALGGHAVLAVGYDRTAQRFICRNSWGTQWGQKGYFTMPFTYLTNRNLSDDFWTVRRAENL